MSEFDSIKNELKSKVKDKQYLDKVESELDFMSKTNGLEGMNNLESFYNIYKKHSKDKGSANEINSWTAYAIGMTSKKPDGDFMFNRRAFVRAGFPDIDTDFDDERRGEVYQYIIDKYGRENVGNIGTYMAQKMKGAIRNVSKAVDAAKAFHKGKQECVSMNHELANDICKTLEVAPTGVIKWKDEDGKEIVIKSIEKAFEHIPDFRSYMKKYPEVYQHARHIEGILGSFSQHAAGIVVSDIPLEKIAPLRKSQKGLATQYAYEDLESIGLIKFDILAIAALTVIRDAMVLIKENYGIDVDIKNLPLDDKKTLELYRSGNLNGVFQFENPGMQDTARQIGVDRFSDIVACVSLYRPGPMDSIPEYVSRKKGYKKVDYFHPSIEPHVKDVLAETYGVLCYQEQVMSICNSLAGFSISDGYVMIKAVGKKKEHLMKRYEEQFVTGCVAKKIPREIAQQYWTQFIIPFANYGFNKSHACCYGYLGWQTAYLKANFPDEFSVAFLNTFMRRAFAKSGKDREHVAMMEKDAKRISNIKILNRSINECGAEYKIVKKKDPSAGVTQTEVRPPIFCKGIGYETVKHLVENQPYKSAEDLATKTETRYVNAETVTALCEGGYIDGKKGRDNVDKLVEKFNIMREDMKLSKRKGIASVDIFG